ncbi:MAG TPA: cytochrome P450 [Caulobacteraceae bacterium]|nr:cytochrome P450 [Caulobacteraceae bacterium]
MSVGGTHPGAVDLSDSRSFARGFPHPYFTWLREHAPVFWHEPTAVTPEGEGFWVVSRQADVLAVQTQPALFSSETGGGLRAAGGTAINDDTNAGRALNATDDPKHAMLRSVVMKGFTLHAVAALEADIRRRVDLLIDAFPENEPFDFVAAFAREVPLQAICMVLGVPQEDRLQLCEWVDAGLSTASPSILDGGYARRIADYGLALIGRKRAEPKDDILSVIVHARPDEAGGRPLNEGELRSFFLLLFAAGAETTRSAIAGGMKALIENPEQMALLRAEPGRLKTAIEEFVRWTTPSIYKRRTASSDTVLAGQTIRAGQKVTFWEMSANRDERAFERPFAFDITRSPNPHLGFGYGVHVCLGSMLARLEMRVAYEALLRRVAGFALAGPEDWMPSNRLLGIRRLPITITHKARRPKEKRR